MWQKGGMGKLLFAALALTLPSAAANAINPFGLWQNDDGRVLVKVEMCGDALCGKVASLREPLDRQGRPKVDHKNPDPALRDRQVIGLVVLSGFVRSRDEPDRWVNGTVYDADSGNTYQGTLTLRPDGTAEVHGYVLVPVIGRTSLWRQVQ